MANLSNSATPTVVDDSASAASDFVEHVHHDLYPDHSEQKKHPFLVEFDPGDSDNPKVCSPAMPGDSLRARCSC